MRHSAVLSKGLCVSGEGPGCAERTEDNPLIRDLQEKSRANKDKHEQATRDRYWSEGYGSYFSYGFGRELRKDLTTGEWSLVRPDDEMAKAVERAGLDWRNID